MSTLLGLLIALGLLVTVHEFGHFWVARRCGVKVLRFSIGFGWPLWRRVDRHGSEFVIAAIPLGGYVRMLDGRDKTTELSESQREMAFDSKPFASRAAIILAGPLANLLFALALHWLALVSFGVVGLAPLLSEPPPGSPAALAGLSEGSEIVAVDGAHVETMQEVATRLLRRVGESGELSIEALLPGADPESQTVVASIELDNWLVGEEQPDVLGSLGLFPAMGAWPPVVEHVVAESPAEQAGLQVGDVIRSIEGEEVSDWAVASALLRARPNERVSIEVERSGSRLELAAQLQERSTARGATGFLGVRVKPISPPEDMRRARQIGPFSAFVASCERVWLHVAITFEMIAKMVLGSVSPATLGGPVMIAQIAGDSLERGLLTFLNFLALLSVSLAVINLLPIPVLDGGQLLLLVCERVRGKALGERALMWVNGTGMLMVAMLMALAIGNDLTRLLGS